MNDWYNVLYQGIYWPCQEAFMVNFTHYDDVIMGAMSSQITSLTIVYSIVYSGTDQRKHQSSASLAVVREFTGDRWIPRTKGQLRGKCFHLMTSSCYDLWFLSTICITLIARFMGPTWGPSGADRTEMGLMLSPWTFLPENCYINCRSNKLTKHLIRYASK